MLNPLLRHGHQTAYSVVLALLTLFIIAPAIMYDYYSSKISLMQFSDGTIVSASEITEDEIAEDVREMDAATADLEAAEAIEAEGEVYEDEGVINILLIGTDERTKRLNTNARGDSCMLLSINKKNMQVHLVSFERGMGVPILSGQYKGQYDWLTHTFRYGGADLMMREVSECFKVDVEHYVRVNFYTFQQLIDSIGGVDIELTEREAQGLNGELKTNAWTHTRVHAGTNHLDGYDTLQYSRIRYIDSDWGRIGRQRNVIQRIIMQTKTLGISELNSMLNDVLPLVQTNLTEDDISDMLKLLPRYKDVTVEQMTVPAKGTYGSMTGMGGRSLFAVDFAKNADILHEALYDSGEAE